MSQCRGSGVAGRRGRIIAVRRLEGAVGDVGSNEAMLFDRRRICIRVDGMGSLLVVVIVAPFSLLAVSTKT